MSKDEAARQHYDCPVTHSNGSTRSRRLLAFLYRAAQGALRRPPPLFERVLVGPVARDIASSEQSKLVGALGVVR